MQAAKRVALAVLEAHLVARSMTHILREHNGGYHAKGALLDHAACSFRALGFQIKRGAWSSVKHGKTFCTLNVRLPTGSSGLQFRAKVKVRLEAFDPIDIDLGVGAGMWWFERADYKLVLEPMGGACAGLGA
jgi:hypothetical protein